MTVHLTFISLYRQRDFRVVSQWKPLPFSHELPINKSSIGTVVFNVGNVGVLWTHFLKEKKHKGKGNSGGKRLHCEGGLRTFAVVGSGNRLPRLFHKPCQWGMAKSLLKGSALKVLKPWFP